MSATRPQFTATTVCLIADVQPATLRAWRNKNGLFNTPDKLNKWHRFSLADLCVVRFVNYATKSGLSAEAAVSFGRHLGLAFAMLLDGVDHPTFAFITDRQCAFLEAGDQIAAYVAQRQPEDAEVALFVDLQTIARFVARRLVEITSAPTEAENT